MLDVPYELFIALRYLRAKRKQVVISVITIIAIAAVAAGVAALIVVLSMMTGFREEVQTRILSGTAHLNLLRKDGHTFEHPQQVVEKLSQLPHIRSASPTLYDEVLMMGSKSSTGVILKGVDMNTPRAANEVWQFTMEGNPEGLATPATDPDTGAPLDRIVIGRDLAQTIGLKVGDVATVLSPQGHLTPLGMSPKYKDFQVVGLFTSGLSDYDAKWAYLSLEAARRLSGTEDVVQLIQMKVDQVDNVKAIGREVLQAMGDAYTVQDWQELNAPIYTALSYEKLLSTVALLIVIAIAALNIISVLIMIVMEKQRDIAILKSMGATRRSVMWIFILQGLLIGIVGLGLGMIGGTIFCSYANARRLIQLPQGAYALDYLPFHVKVNDLLVVALVTLLISFVSTIYPAWSAARLHPVEGLRYE
ncbi:MAG: ABC transporter permease [Acidobacteria bacterium]|nr:ABC transporter permease [Acidobacteriota bacterium]